MCKIFLSFAVDTSGVNRILIKGTTQKVTYQAIMRKVQMLLSDRFLGFFMVPTQGSWNYNFMGMY